MKLPSGREISIDSLADIAASLATDSFSFEDSDEAENIMIDNLESDFVTFGDAKSPFEEGDVEVIMNIVRNPAQVIAGKLAEIMDSYTPLSGPSPLKSLIEMEVENAERKSS